VHFVGVLKTLNANKSNLIFEATHRKNLDGICRASSDVFLDVEEVCQPPNHIAMSRKLDTVKLLYHLHIGRRCS